MDKYKKYMDSVEPSPEFREKLKRLDLPRRPAAWKRYGALAAALALVIGLGGWVLGRDRDAIWNGETVEIGPAEQIHTDIAIYPVPSGQLPDSQPTGGGYEVTDGEVAAYYMLPYIQYQEEDSRYAADYSLAPPGALSREATLEDVILMVGHADALWFHLGWDDSLEWGGVVWFEESGDPCAASIYAKGEDVIFSFEMMEGSEVPECCIIPDESYTTSEFCGVEILGLKNVGWCVDDNGVEMRESRKVSFFTGEMGYKLTIYGVDGTKVDELAARFTRWAIVEGFDLDAAVRDGAEPVYGGVGEPNYEGEATTPAYDPNQN